MEWCKEFVDSLNGHFPTAAEVWDFLDKYIKNIEDSHDDGYAQGYADGLADGKRKGYAEGLLDGRDAGYDLGWAAAEDHYDADEVAARAAREA
jgi:flagellar biosynthesis/type III secretory pathway protein FliH